MLPDEISTRQEETRPDNPCDRQLSPVAQPPQHGDGSLNLLRRQTGFFPAAFLVTLKHCFKSRFQRRAGLFFRQERELLPQSCFFTAGGTRHQMFFHFSRMVRTEPALQIIRQKFANFFAVHCTLPGAGHVPCGPLPRKAFPLSSCWNICRRSCNARWTLVFTVPISHPSS